MWVCVVTEDGIKDEMGEISSGRWWVVMKKAEIRSDPLSPARPRRRKERKESYRI